MKKVVRPWGNFKQFAFNEQCTVKILEVKPHQRLSYQKHKNREENWYFITDGFTFIDGVKEKHKAGDLVVVGKEQPHRLIAGEKTLLVLEVAYGEFDEDDEVRLEDDYGRKNPK